MPSAGQDIASVIKKQIEEFGGELSMVDVGTVIEAADGVARIHGLSGVKYSEVLSFPGGVLGMALNLEENGVGAVILGDYLGIKEGEVITHSMITKSIERAQKKIEAMNFGSRKNIIEYDDVMNYQRDIVYTRRNYSLHEEDVSLELKQIISEYLIH